MMIEAAGKRLFFSYRELRHGMEKLLEK